MLKTKHPCLGRESHFYDLVMCFSVHFRIVLSDTPTNAQIVFLYKKWTTCFDSKGLSSGLYMYTIPIIADKKYSIFLPAIIDILFI